MEKVLQQILIIITTMLISGTSCCSISGYQYFNVDTLDQGVVQVISCFNLPVCKIDTLYEDSLINDLNDTWNANENVFIGIIDSVIFFKIDCDPCWNEDSTIRFSDEYYDSVHVKVEKNIKGLGASEDIWFTFPRPNTITCFSRSYATNKRFLGFFNSSDSNPFFNIYNWSGFFLENNRIFKSPNPYFYNPHSLLHFISTDLQNFLNSKNAVVIQNKPNFNISNFKVFPNPFKSSINISYPNTNGLNVSIFTSSGKLVKTLSQSPNVWDGKDNSGNQVPSGIYLILLKANGQVYNRRVSLVR